MSPPGLELSEGRNPGRLGSGDWHTHTTCWIINTPGTDTHKPAESVSEDVTEHMREQVRGMSGEV